MPPKTIAVDGEMRVTAACRSGGASESGGYMNQALVSRSNLLRGKESGWEEGGRHENRMRTDRNGTEDCAGAIGARVLAFRRMADLGPAYAQSGQAGGQQS